MIEFFYEEINFTLDEPEKVRFWLKDIVSGQEFQMGELNYIFCSDNYLHKINLEYLNHDTLTDIITFPAHGGSTQIVAGDIFISIERIRENAEEYDEEFEDELHRVMVHGVLHMMGYKDKTVEQSAFMRNAEDEALRMWK